MNKLPIGLQEVLGGISGFLLMFAYLPYLYVLLNDKKLKPRPFSWLGWMLLTGITVGVQMYEKGFAYNQIGMVAATIGCGLIAFFSFKRGGVEIKTIDSTCLSLGILCIPVYLLSDGAWTTTMFAIAADFIIAIPTIKNAWDDPESEKSPSWTIGYIGHFFAIVACIGYEAIYWAFPVFLFGMNLLMERLTYRRGLAH